MPVAITKATTVTMTKNACDYDKDNDWDNNKDNDSD